MTPSALRAGPPFTIAGLTLVVIGGLTWVTDSWFLRIGGLVAILVGAYVLLVGIGLLRVRSGLQRRAAEAELDAAVLATAGATGPAGDGTTCGPGESCGTCAVSCELRR